MVRDGTSDNGHFRGVAWRVFAVVLMVIGAYLSILGGQLLWLGGSGYYIAAGLLTVVSGVLIWRGDRRGAWVYAAMYALTVAWSLWETGFEAWQLMARLFAPAMLGLPLVFSAIWRRAGGRTAAFAGLALVVVLGGSLVQLSRFQPGAADAGFKLAATQPAIADGDWRTWGRTDSGTRFAPFTQVNQTNVDRLEVAWTYRSGHSFGQNTPLKIGDRLYLCAGDNSVMALDAETGREAWTFDPTIRANAYGRACRGVAYHERSDGAVPAGATDGDCRASIYVSTRDARLIALDAVTGKPCSDFGQGGTVDLNTGMGPDPAGYLYASSPPTVVGDIVIVANCVYDGQAVDEPSGVVRAFDARTGKLIWAWDGMRPDITAAPPPGQTYTRGTPNVWSVMSVDPALGLVFLPTGNPTPDYYGGYRGKDLEKYAASTVALDVKTGKVRWSFQTVHHDIWDYDVPSQPVLFDFPTAGGKVPAVLQPTKRGDLFVLDRRTGKPITKVEEKPVPQGHIAPGEWLSPTQPFSTGMPSLNDPDWTEADMWGLTPLDQLWCRVKFRQARYDGHLTPIGLEPSLRGPGSSGIYNWGSISIDEDTGIMVAATLHLANYDRLIPRASPEARQFDRRNAQGHAEIGPGAGGPQRGTPYAVSNPPFFSPLAVPCTEPPFGRVAAIDLNTRKVLWNKAVGTTASSGPFGMSLGLPLPMGVPVSGGFLVTRGGLSFYGAAQDGYLRAYATRSGSPLWRAKLPVGTESIPMSYLAPRSGRQMIVIAVGGAVGSTQKGDYVIAYALPASAAPKR